MISHAQMTTATPESSGHLPRQKAGEVTIVSKTRQTKQPPLPPVHSGPNYVPTNQPFITTVESIQNAASGASRWQSENRQAPHYIRRTAKSSTIIEYGRCKTRQVFTERAILNLWRDVKEFSDQDVDLLLSIFSTLIRETDGVGAAWIWASNFLDQRGVRPIMKREGATSRRAGHRTEDLADIDEAIYRLSQLWITIDEVLPPHRKGGKVRVFRHQGRVLIVVEEWNQQTLSDQSDHSDRMPVAWRIRAGDWLHEYLQVPRYVAALCQKSLHYNPIRERWEKRLSRYFLFFLRINARHSEAILVREVGELLEANSLFLNQRNPHKTRKQFEQAMDRLTTDGHIDAWEYVQDSRADLPCRNWLTHWLAWRVRISARARQPLPE